MPSFGDVGPKDVPELRTWQPPVTEPKTVPDGSASMPTWLKWGLIGIAIYFGLSYFKGDSGRDMTKRR